MMVTINGLTYIGTPSEIAEIVERFHLQGANATSQTADGNSGNSQLQHALGNTTATEGLK